MDATERREGCTPACAETPASANIEINAAKCEQSTSQSAAEPGLGQSDGLTFEHVAGNVTSMILDEGNAGALFQAASQFNCLEMVGPGVTPQRGVTCYFSDPTQGPKCALACPAGTIYRNYLCQGGKGQGERQIDCLQDVGIVLGNQNDKLWEMQNGYCLPTNSKTMGLLGELLRSEPKVAAEAQAALRVGLYLDSTFHHL